MRPVRRHLAVLLLATGTLAVSQAPSRNLILLDPAHGGTDGGATVSGTLEKDLTLGLATNLRALLASRNFNVAVTRDADQLLTADQRAATANHLHPAACLLLHATATGNGIHVVTSSLPPLDGPPSPALPWNTAQGAFVAQSRVLANILGLALVRAKLPITLTPAAVRPLDTLTCPAVVIEVAPLTNGAHPTPPTDAAYQHRLADAIATALTDWRNALPAAGATP